MGEAQRIEVLLAEFAANKTEIANRSAAQHTLLNLQLTLSGTIAGLVITKKTDATLLFILPLLSASLGLLYFDHAQNIESKGTFLREQVWPALTRAAGDDQLLSSESQSHEFAQKLTFRYGFAFPVLFMFAGPALFAAIAVIPVMSLWWTMVLEIVGILAILILLASWWAFFQLALE